MGRAATHEELRERLRRKMEELRGRNLSTNEERRKRKLKSKLSKAGAIYIKDLILPENLNNIIHGSITNHHHLRYLSKGF